MWIQTDLTRASYDELVSGVDVVVHLAGMVSRDPKDATQMYRLHVDLTRKLLEVCDGKRLILASTSGTIAVSPEDIGPMDEQHHPTIELLGRWPYYLSKYHQERLVLQWCMSGRGEAVILNPSLLLGPGDDKLTSTTDVLDVLNRRYPAAVAGTLAMVDVRDAAPVFARAISRGKSGQRYLLSGANMSVRRFAERVAQLGSVPSPKVVLPGTWAVAGAKLKDGIRFALRGESSTEPVSVDMARHHWACQCTLARETFDFSPRDPGVTLKDTIAELAKRRLFRPVHD